MSVKMPRNVLLKVGVLASGGGVLFGYDMGVVSGALTQLRDNFKLTCYQQEMIVSSMLIGAFTGSIIGGYLIDKFGRKTSIIFSCVLYLLGAILLGVSPSYWLLILGRLIVGFGMALSAASECVYVSEISPLKRRGSLVSLNELGITIGILISYFINLAFAKNVANGWRFMFSLAGVGAIFILIVTLQLPESPRYLLMKGRNKEAKEALLRMRIQNHENEINSVEQEFTNMEHYLKPKENSSFRTLLKDRKVYNAIFIGAMLVVFQQSTGEPNVLYYASTILRGMGFQSDIVASLGSIGLGVAKVFATILCLVYVDRLGRKTFLLIGCIIMTISILGVALLTINSNIQQDNLCKDFNETLNITNTSMISQVEPAFKWIALVLLMLFIAAYSIGFGPITWILLSEIFPANIRGRLFSYVTSLNWIINLIISTTFLSFADATGGLTWPFIVSSILGFVSIFFIYFFVPETKGKSLEDVIGHLDNPLTNQIALNCGRCCGKKEEPFLPLIQNNYEM